MNVYFMRHGETDWNTVRRLQGRTDIPLNENGIKLAEQTSAAVHKTGITFDRIFTSPLCRAVKTAELMNLYSNAPIIKDDRIIEFCFGEGEGHTFEEIKTTDNFPHLKNWFLNPGAYTAQQGSESFDDFFGRIDSFLSSIREIEFKMNQESPEKASAYNILIVCHGGVVKGLAKQMLDWSVEDYDKVKIPNCGLNLVTLHNGIFNLEYTAKTFVPSNLPSYS